MLWCETAMVSYIVFGIFIYNEGYLDFEASRGAVATHVSGDFVALSSGRRARYFTAEELTAPGLENGNVFVATRQSLVRQRRGVCEDEEMSCEGDEDCHQRVEGRCSEKGYCVEPSWCPMEASKKRRPQTLGLALMMPWTRLSVQSYIVLLYSM